jgi:hypothetical protein
LDIAAANKRSAADDSRKLAFSAIACLLIFVLTAAFLPM